MFPAMPFDIRELATVEQTLSNLNDLIRACRPRGRFYGHDNALAREVTRQAKGLHTSLTRLKEALDDPQHQPIKEETMAKEALDSKLYWIPAYHELARFISYGGKRTKDVKEKCDELRKQFGDEKVMWALHELTTTDEQTGLTVLRPEARKLSRQLLGPPPEDPDYENYWRINRREPPPDHQPPGPEEEEAPKPKKRGRGR